MSLGPHGGVDEGHVRSLEADGALAARKVAVHRGKRRTRLVAPVTGERANAVLNRVIDVSVALVASPSSAPASIPIGIAMVRVARSDLHAYLATFVDAIML